MNHKRRIALLILVWIVIAVVVSVGAFWYGYSRSVENAERTIHAALKEADKMVPQLLRDENFIRYNYERTRTGLTELIPILQDYGVEEEVPSKAKMKKYAELLEASWLAVKDQEGNVLVSAGKEKKGVMQRLESPDTSAEMPDEEWLTTARALNDEETALIVTDLKGGNQLFCQMSNEELNSLEKEVFSWRTSMHDLKLTDNAYFIVISQTDDTVLVHPDNSFVGKTVEQLGYDSIDGILDQFKEPGEDGIAMLKDDHLGFFSYSDQKGKLLDVTGWETGYINTKGLYVICTVPMEVSLLYILQQYGELIIFLIGTLLVLCYICFHFSDIKRRRQKMRIASADADGSGEPAEEMIGYRFGFCYDRGWSRRLILCCIIVLVGMLLLSAQLQLLNNGAQKRIQKSQMKQYTQELEKTNAEQKRVLNNWFNVFNIQVADVVTYCVTRDETLQTRTAVKDISKRMNVTWIYLFDQKGRIRVTNSNYDHLNLYEMKKSRMARTLLPLLDGQFNAASTPFTESRLTEEEQSDLEPSEVEKLYDYAATDDQYLAYAGISIRNKDDLCDGCVAIATVPFMELMDSEELIPDIFADILRLAKGTDSGEELVLSAVQLRMIRYLMLFTVLCLFLFCCIGTLQREKRMRRGYAGAEEDVQDKPGIGKKISGALGAKSPFADDSDFINWIGSLSGRENTSILDRWKTQKTPLRYRSAERKLFFVLRCILVALFFIIVFASVSEGHFLTEHSPLHDLVRGGWEKGLNIYAITASEMIIIVAIVLCSALHHLVFFIACFSSPRGETICHLVYSVITYAAVLVTTYYCLSLFGVQTKTLLASAGILGIVVTFGAQKTIADILSGMFLIFEDAVHVGDWIEVGDKQGMVKSIGVRLTKIESLGTIITINNADLVELRNYSKGDTIALLKCNLYLDYSNDMVLVEEVIARELPTISKRMRECSYITSDVKYVGIWEFADSSIVLKFKVHCQSHRYSEARPRMNTELLRMCSRNGIKTAFPHTIIDFGDGVGHVTVDD